MAAQGRRVGEFAPSGVGGGQLVELDLPVGVVDMR
ncbi:hypothetical protein SAMN06265360_101139 [Haloechinothrix alba]|uniref:Uncharacterized protein n=1 Tax=Haloechinothrix alba TaxID=664784 RepID=A0A238V2V6_9PSEU|nr:hypothetical protein SAMN06265360_101139 [Haloechinothrix alba]